MRTYADHEQVEESVAEPEPAQEQASPAMAASLARCVATAARPASPSRFNHTVLARMSGAPVLARAAAQPDSDDCNEFDWECQVQEEQEEERERKRRRKMRKRRNKLPKRKPMTPAESGLPEFF